jgi:hypothetical protein
MTTKESTVAEWQSHFKSNPYQTLPEYKLDWTTIRNNAEGVGSDVGMGTVQKYLKMFRQGQNLDSNYEPITASLGESVPAFKTEHEELAHRIGSDPVASLLILQSQLGSLTIAAEKYVGQCKYINDVLDTTLSMLQENVIWSELEAKAAKLESELSLAQANVKSLEVEATAQKELRLRAVNKTVYGS